MTAYFCVYHRHSKFSSSSFCENKNTIAQRPRPSIHSFVHLLLFSTRFLFFQNKSIIFRTKSFINLRNRHLFSLSLSFCLIKWNYFNRFSFIFNSFLKVSAFFVVVVVYIFNLNFWFERLKKKKKLFME